MMQRGDCSADSMAWHEGLPDWLSLGTILQGNTESSIEIATTKLQPVANAASQTSSESPPDRAFAWYERSAFVFPALLLCFPLGLLPLWLTRRLQIGVKVALSVAVALVYGGASLVGLLVLVVASAAKEPPRETSIATEEERLSDQDLLQRWVEAEGPVRRRLARLRLKREPNNEYLQREVMEADVEDAAIEIANRVFGGRYVLGVEAAQYSQETGGKFPLVVYVTNKRLASQDSLRAFYGAIKDSSACGSASHVFVAFGATQFYDVYGNAGLPAPSGVTEFMLSMRGIKRTNWKSLSDSEMDRLFAAEGHSGGY